MKNYLVTTSGNERNDGERGYAWLVLADNKKAATTAAVGYHEVDARPGEKVRVDGCVADAEDDGLGAINDLTGNRRRWERVQDALIMQDYMPEGEEPRTAVVDILADIMHFCASKRIGFKDALESAEMHFRAERFSSWS